jgi:hypothetical protein
MKRLLFSTALWSAALLGAALLGGCGTLNTFPSTVSVFSEWDAGGQAAKTFAFVRSAAQQNSLEHKTYEQSVRSALLAKGFTESETGARYKVAINYAVSEDKIRRELYAEGPWGGGLGWGLGFSGSRFGFGFNRFVELPWYSRELRVDISDAASGAKRYEARAVNDSQSKEIAPAMPYLAQAALSEFPQASGSSKVVRVPIAE